MLRTGLLALAFFFAGLAQSLGQVPMAATILRTAEEQFRGRVMGIRMLAIYGNLPGLWIAGPLIAGFGYPFMATSYCVFGILCVCLITWTWREQIWRVHAPANRR